MSRLAITADSRHTHQLVTALQECLRRVIEGDRLAADLAAQAAEVQRLQGKVIHLEAPGKEREASPVADVTVCGEAPAGSSMPYDRKTRFVVITRPDGVPFGPEVYPGRKLSSRRVIYPLALR